MNKRFHSCLSTILLVLASLSVQADAPSLGEMSDNMVSSLSVVSTVLYKSCYVFGAILLVAGGNLFIRYRRNPTETPLSRWLMYLLFGVLLILLPFFAQHSGGGKILQGVSA
jgi:hypothetical protein